MTWYDMHAQFLLSDTYQCCFSLAYMLGLLGILCIWMSRKLRTGFSHFLSEPAKFCTKSLDVLINTKCTRESWYCSLFDSFFVSCINYYFKGSIYTDIISILLIEFLFAAVAGTGAGKCYRNLKEHPGTGRRILKYSIVAGRHCMFFAM